MERRQLLTKSFTALWWLFFLLFSAPTMWRILRSFVPRAPLPVTASCRDAILKGETQLNQLSNVQLKNKYWASIDFQYDVPADRPRKYQYILENTSGIRNVFSSPLLLSSISKEIIHHCPETGMVGFSDARFAAYKNYGRYPDSDIKQVCRPGLFSHLNPFSGGRWTDNCEQSRHF